MARTKHTTKKRTVQEDIRPSQAGRILKKEPRKSSGKKKPVPSVAGVSGVKNMKKSQCF